jgi:glutamate-ammonia-ligase adenylyltransferase
LALANTLIDAINPVRWPSNGLDDDGVRAIRKLKMRVDRERGGIIRERQQDRTAINSRDLKLGPGGLADIEWTVQLAQLRHGAKVPELRVTSSRAALNALVKTGLFTPAAVADLTTAWVLASRMRNAIMLVRGRASDHIPTDAREIAALALLLGYGKAGASKLLDDWARASRRAMAVVDCHFWGLE